MVNIPIAQLCFCMFLVKVPLFPLFLMVVRTVSIHIVYPHQQILV